MAAAKRRGYSEHRTDAISLAVKNSLYAYGMAYKCQHEVDKTCGALDTRQDTWKFILRGLLKNG